MIEIHLTEKFSSLLGLGLVCVERGTKKSADEQFLSKMKQRKHVK
jgi:hypothetical protein